MPAFFKSFAWAAKGLAEAVRTERNLRFDLCAAVYVYFFSIFYALSGRDYVLLTILICGVLAMEILNSAVERIVDMLCPGYNKLAGSIKNIAAGAVLVFCIGAAVCGFFVFWDIAVFKRIFAFFIEAPWRLVLLAVSLALAGWFVFGFGRDKKKGEPSV